MFISISEDTQDHPLRSGQTFCKHCEQYANLRLVERVRTVTAYWVLKSTERKHFLICDSCQGQFLVKPHNKGDLEQADIHTLLGMAGSRYVPFFARAILFLALLCLPIPLLNLLLVFAASRNKRWYTPAMLKLSRFVFWAAVAVNVAFIIAALVEKDY
jgi:hypothetical protein